jgi:hypothetical protein
MNISSSNNNNKWHLNNNKSAVLAELDTAAVINTPTHSLNHRVAVRAFDYVDSNPPTLLCLLVSRCFERV